MENNEFIDILEKAKEQLGEIKDKIQLNNLKAKFLGKKGEVTSLFSKLGTASIEERKLLGKKINDVKVAVENLFGEKEKQLNEEQLKEKLESEKIDITLPGHDSYNGIKHPFTKIVDLISEFFIGYGYSVKSGPEVELDYFNFECLNIPKDHPARDMQDSFFIEDNILLRSHTSPVQARVMQDKNLKLPLKVICPGKVYRRDNDATHSHQFGQIEGLCIGEDVNLSNLIKTLDDMIHFLFGSKVNMRFRPSFFPFTEPSIEVDISCFECHGVGCSLCKGSGWIEVLGAGMVNPNVFRLNNIDSDKYQGFAFGIGIERMAMLLYGIDDIHRFYTDDVNFLKQFNKE